MNNLKNDLQKLINEHNGDGKSGFFDLPKKEQCNHPEHFPPSHIYIPQGKGYRHVCPGCGKVEMVIPPQVSF